MTCLCWNANTAHAQAVTPEELLNAYYDLWQQLERQPISEDFDARSLYTADRYLEEWDNWENVRQALVDFLYQRALFAALQQDTETAAEYYRKCLEIDPNHQQARAAYGVNLDEAALRRDEFTAEKAGSPAMSSFLSFLAYRDRDEEQAARDYFMLAQSQKEGFVASEIAKLQDMYDTAVDLYNRGSFAAAINQF